MAMSIVQSSQFKRAPCPLYVELWKISILWMNGWESMVINGGFGLYRLLPTNHPS